MDLKVLNSKRDSLGQHEPINFKICFLCQSTKKISANEVEHLADPFKKKGKSISESYDSLVAILKVRLF